MKKFLLIALMLAGLVGLSGCVAVVAGTAAGTVVYVRGELQIHLNNSLIEVNDAVEISAEEMKLFELSASRDLLSGRFAYRDARDRRISIHTDAQTTETTKLGIRVGTFGDQQQSQLILDRIRTHLPSSD